MCSMLKYMDDRFEDYDRKKLQFYVYVSLLSYIPYDKNSIIYYQEKLNNSMVEEKKLHVARAKNAINTLLRDDIVLDNEEISEIYDMYDQLSNNKFKKNLPGIIALTVQTNLNLLYQDKKNKTIEYIRNMYENSKSDEINLEDYFELNEYPLTEDRKMYLDSIVELQTK